MVAMNTSQDVVVTVVLILAAMLWTLMPLSHVRDGFASLGAASRPVRDVDTERYEHSIFDAPLTQLPWAQTPVEEEVFTAVESVAAVFESEDLRSYRKLEAANIRAAMGTDQRQRFVAEKALASAHRDLGQTQSALRMYEKASTRVATSLEEAALLSEIGETYMRRGEMISSIESLRTAMAALDPADGGHSTRLTAEINERLGKAHHTSVNAWDFGETHEHQALEYYGDALRTAEDSSRAKRLKRERARLLNGEGPSPTPLMTLRRSTVPLPPDADAERIAALPLAERIPAYVTELLPEKAEAEVLVALSTALGDEALVPLLNLLGEVRRAQACYESASELYSLSLELALTLPGDVNRPDTADAYYGLSYCQAAFHSAGRGGDAVAIYDSAMKLVDAAGVDREGEAHEALVRRLEANALAEVSGPTFSLQCFAKSLALPAHVEQRLARK